MSDSDNPSAATGFAVTILLVPRLEGVQPVISPLPNVLPYASALIQDYLIALELPAESINDQQIVVRVPRIESALRLVQHAYALLAGFLSSQNSRSVWIGICIATSQPTFDSPLRKAFNSLSDRDQQCAVLLAPQAYEQLKAMPALTFKAADLPGLHGFWTLCPPDWFSAAVAAGARPTTAVPARSKKQERVAPTQNSSPNKKLESFLSSVRRHAVILGVAVLCIVIGILWKSFAPARHRAEQTSNIPHSDSNSSRQTPTPAHAHSPSTPAITPPLVRPPVVPTPKEAISIPGLKKSLPAHSDERESSAKEHLGGGGMSAEDLQRTLQRADSASGNGQYPEAIAYYNYILKRDPHNAAALRGRARAEQNGRAK